MEWGTVLARCNFTGSVCANMQATDRMKIEGLDDLLREKGPLHLQRLSTTENRSGDCHLKFLGLGRQDAVRNR